MTNIDIPPRATTGFTSYTRVDNEDFGGVVDRLRRDLMGMYEAMTGKQLSLFLDRESIGWGEEWRQKIHESVGSASVFIPIVTMRYFNSQMCMEELLTFHAAAERLGVTELILPVVLFGADQISTEDQRPEVRLIARLNYQNAEAAWAAGYDSTEWRSFVADCVRKLDVAIQRAESALAEEEKGSVARVRASSGDPVVSSMEQGEDETSLFDLADMTDRMELIEPLTEQALAELEVIGDLISGFTAEGLTARGAKVGAIRLADSLAEPARKIEQTGNELEKVMFGLDSDIRALVSELSAIDLPEAREQVVELLASFQGAEMAAVEREIQQAIDAIRFATIGNLTLRRALDPATRGFRSMKNAVGVFGGWQALLDGLQER